MKKVKLIVAMIALCGFVLGGCATYLPGGSIYTGVQGPIGTAAGNVKYSKVGKASAKSVLGFVAFGDCSIQTAVKNGGIKKIKYIDWDVDNILGIGTYTTTVYGD